MFNQKEYNKQYNKNHPRDRSNYNKQWYEDNKEKVGERHRQYNKNNSEKIKEYKKLWYKNNPEYDKQYYKDHPRDCSDYHKGWYKNNTERENEKHRQFNKANYKKLKEYKEQWLKNNPKYMGEYERNRRKIDLKFNLNRKIKDMMSHSLKGNKRGRHWESLVNYTLNDLIKRLKKTMPRGYTWQDYLKGKLHIDHIIPIRAFEFEIPEDKEFKQCWNLYNLRLLSVEENILKGDKIINPILLNLLFNEVK